jgi:drug/metabolite transporter (DMT)-like permease
MTHIIAQDVTMVVSPPTVLLFRACIAAIALYGFVMIRERKINLFTGIERKDQWMLLLLGALNILINQFLYLEGLRFTTPANSALLYAMTPAVVYIFAMILHSERTTWKKACGILVAFVGVTIIIFERGPALEASHTAGNILIFIAVIAWSLFTLLGRPLVKKYGALRTTALHMTLGALLYLPFGLLSTSIVEVQAITPTLWLDILYLGLVASCINYYLWYYALGKLETSKVAIFQNLQPVLTTVIALYLGRVVFSLELFGGGVMALIGILIVEFA